MSAKRADDSCSSCDPLSQKVAVAERALALNFAGVMCRVLRVNYKSLLSSPETLGVQLGAWVPLFLTDVFRRRRSVSLDYYKVF